MRSGLGASKQAAVQSTRGLGHVLRGATWATRAQRWWSSESDQTARLLRGSLRGRPTVRPEADVAAYVRWHQCLRREGGDWRQLANDREKWDMTALSYAAHVVPLLSGIVWHVRCDTNAVGDLGHSAYGTNLAKKWAARRDVARCVGRRSASCGPRKGKERSIVTRA